MNKNNKTYLLFIYTMLDGDSPILRDIPLQLSPISSAPHIKYNYIDNGMICNFESDAPFDELREFVSMVLSGLVEQYFLIEHSDNLSVHMDNSLKLNLFDLNSTNKNYKNSNENMSHIMDDDELHMFIDLVLHESERKIDDDYINSIIFDEDEDDEDPLIRKLRIKKDSMFMKPSLDFLLEKIKEKGIKSLTKYEKQLLNEYAGN